MPLNFNWRVIIGGIFVACLICGFLVLVVWLIKPQKKQPSQPTAAITVIYAPSATPILPRAVLPTTTKTVSPGEIAVGIYVQIVGTGGEGLRFRSGPGVKNQALFLGMEKEVYMVKEGPSEADGYTWWLLVAPYDENRKGWAASKYLTIITTPIQ
jgi:hypothetical protein